jgi:salicylate hydroxylase
MAVDSPPLSSARILIIGGGMGGLATALALARRGFTNIAVFEMASKLAEVGAGINITPNLARLLDRFGVLDILREEAVVIRSANILSKSLFATLHWRKYLRNIYRRNQ